MGWEGLVAIIGAAIGALSAAAAYRSATASARSADAAERIARLDEERAAREIAEARRNQVRWEHTQDEHGLVTVRNVGTGTAYNVRFDLPDGNEPWFQYIREGTAEDILVMLRDCRGNRKVTMRWNYEPDLSDDGGEEWFFIELGEHAR